jgi:hypothetical protein
VILKPSRRNVLALTVSMYALVVAILLVPAEVYAAVFPLAIAGMCVLSFLTLRMQRQLVRQGLSAQSRRDRPG